MEAAFSSSSPATKDTTSVTSSSYTTSMAQEIFGADQQQQPNMLRHDHHPTGISLRYPLSSQLQTRKMSSLVSGPGSSSSRNSSSCFRQSYQSASTQLFRDDFLLGCLPSRLPFERKSLEDTVSLVSAACDLVEDSLKDDLTLLPLHAAFEFMPETSDWCDPDLLFD